MDSFISNEYRVDIMKAPQSHLAFYKELGVSPVHQDIANFSQHLDRRRSLYRSLGVLPSLIRNAHVLEVAPGSGHNSLFIATCAPSVYTMVEPNPVGVREIKDLYATLDCAHTKPDLVASKLEDFAPPSTFDIVICEGWLGSDPHEHEMLAKLGSMVTLGGVICVSLVSPIGLLPNILRRLLASQLSLNSNSDIRIPKLKEAFSQHLDTLPDMSRPHEDWIIDNMINPAWYGVCLTPSMAVEALKDDFAHLGFSPRMITDWRWYKSLYGDNRKFNEVFLESFYSMAHNLLDHRTLFPSRDPAQNRAIESTCFDLLEKTMACEFNQGDIEIVYSALDTLLDLITPISQSTAKAIAETQTLLRQNEIKTADIASMTHLKPLFGREMMYASFTREA